MYEMRIDYGPGYRIYFLRQDDSILGLSVSEGDKDSQRRDIPRSRRLGTRMEGEKWLKHSLDGTR